MRRIAIVGCSGAGKSTLARAVGERLQLPVVHMDSLFWKPGWTESDHEEFRAKVEAAANAEAWVMDGGYITQSTRRFERAEAIVWLELPIWLCLVRAVRRWLLNFGRSRADLAPGCPERFDLAFYDYIWNWDRRTRPRMVRALAEFAPATPVISLRSNRAMRAFVAGLAPASSPPAEEPARRARPPGPG
jgi:adenylate kinase family enzyme